MLLLLAAIQFTTNLDFLIILPLGPQYMRVMHITPAQFNTIVAAYAIAAGISGIAAGFSLDRFDRKTSLVFLYVGFAAGSPLEWNPPEKAPDPEGTQEQLAALCREATALST